MRRRLAKLAPAAVLAAGAIAATGSSAGSATCTPSFDQGVLTITCDGDGAAFTLSHLDGEILLDGSKVGAKVEETTLVGVFTTDGADQVKIDESNGPFLLPFEVEYKSGEGDQLTYLGQKSEANSLLLELDTVKLGDLGTIKLSGVDLVEIKLGDKNDLIDASKWELTDLKLYGDLGDDTLLGGAKADLLSGGPGLNKLVGGESDDLLLEEISFDTFTATDFKLETTLDGSYFKALEGKQETESKVELIELAEIKFLGDFDYKLDAAAWKLSGLKLIGGLGDDAFVGGLKLTQLDGGGGEDKLLESLSFDFGTEYKLETTDGVSFLKALDGSKLEQKIGDIDLVELKLLGDIDYKLDAAAWRLSELKLIGGLGDDAFVGG